MEDIKPPEIIGAQNPGAKTLIHTSMSPGLASDCEFRVQENGVVVDAGSNGVVQCNAGEGNGLGSEDGVVVMDFNGRSTGLRRGSCPKNVVEEEMKGDGRKFEVSGDHISLYVDFSSPLAEVNKGSYVCDNATGLAVSEEGRGRAGAVQEVGMLDCQEFEFSVGDFVWIRMKNLSWWPGRVIDPQVAPEHVKDEEDYLLVGCFGNNHVAPCHPSQLRPFLSHFEQNSRQNKSKSFLCALEMAVYEFGRCLKSEMTCPCVPQANQQSAYKSGAIQGVTTRNCKLNQLGEFTIDKFEPAKFLSQLKSLAVEISSPGVLEYSVALSRVSAFYRFIGHSELPLNTLVEEVDDKETTGVNQKKRLTMTLGGDASSMPEERGDIVSGEGSKKRKRKSNPKMSNGIRVVNETVSIEGNGDEEGKINSEKGFELRERKKSKFLSYPYVNPENQNVPTKSEADQPVVSPPTAKSGAKRFQRKWFQKFNGGAANPELNDASSAELLSELLSTAVDCSHSVESKNFGLTGWFFSRFRISAYHEESIHETNCKNSDSQKEDAAVDTGLSGSNLNDDKSSSSPIIPELKKVAPGSNPEKKTPRRKKNAKSENSKMKSVPVVSDVNVTLNAASISGTDFPVMTPSSVDVQQTSIEVQTNKQNTDIPDLNWSGVLPVSVGGNSQILNFSAPEPKKRRRRKNVSSENSTIMPATGFPVVNGKIGAASGHSGIMSATGFPFVNGNNGAPSEHSATMQTPGFQILNQNNISFSSLMLSFQVNGPYSIKTAPDQKGNAGISHSVQVNAGNSLSVTPGQNGNAGISPGLQDNAGKTGNTISATPGQTRNAGTSPGMQDNAGNSIYVTHGQNGIAGISPGLQDNAGNSFSVTPGVFSLTTEDKPIKRRRKRKTKEAPDATPMPMQDAAIPDLNGTTAEQIAPWKEAQETTGCLLPTDKPQEQKIKRRRKRQSKLGIALSANYDGGSTLLLTFAPGASIPSKEALISTFSKFGPLREAETEVVEASSTAYVVFLRTAEAGEAARSLDETKPYGPALIRHQLQIHPNLGLTKPKPAIPVPSPQVPVSYPQAPMSCPQAPVPCPQINAKEAPPIDYMKKNLEMMTSMLEKSGNDLSPEMRAKLEMEIKGLLKKISTKPGSSSS